MVHENGLFIFRRDLRIQDNLALNKLSNLCKKVHTIFIFTPEQVSNNKYKSDNAIKFMIESLNDLDASLIQKKGKLQTFYGNTLSVVKYLINKMNIDIVSFNIDYSPYAIERDKNIIKLCKKINIDYVFDHDYVLQQPGTVLNKSNAPYQKFTPFYNVHVKMSVERPKTNRMKFTKGPSSLKYKVTTEEMMNEFVSEDLDNIIYGGRSYAILQIIKFKRNIKTYHKDRNTPKTDTSLLSAYIKFGCISIRELYYNFQKNKTFIKQLIWRDFYHHIILFNPHVLTKSMKSRYDKIKWFGTIHQLNAWKKGKTGFPIVDAGIRQLLITGHMHGRTRMIVASFLVKTLGINWQIGERFFANHLLDYDPAVNNGNWQWIAGSGTDSQPYFRIFNPWSQSKEHDKDATYIKQWIPELENIPSKDIHKWFEKHKEYNVKYPEPIIEYSKQKKKVLKMYKKIF